MRTTVTIDDDLYNKALEMADPAMPEIPRNRGKR
jgi:Arc/MetJ family transcription regulator